MADISFSGMKENCITLKKKDTSDIAVGDFVAITATGEADKVSENTDIVGKCVALRNDLVTVQISGYMTGYCASGETVSFGYGAYGISSTGEITEAEGARKILVVEYDSATGKVGFIL